MSRRAETENDEGSWVMFYDYIRERFNEPGGVWPIKFEHNGLRVSGDDLPEDVRRELVEIAYTLARGEDE